MTDYKKIVFSCFLIFAVLGWLVLSKLFTMLASYFDVFAYGGYVEVAVRLAPIALAVGLFAGLYRYNKSYTYMTEVVSELKKVTWPGQKDVSAATVAVIIAVLISAVFIFLFDSVWSFCIQKVIQYGG